MALQSEMLNEKKRLKTYCTFLNNCIDYLAQRTVIEQLPVSYFRTEPCFTLSKLLGDDISDFAQSVLRSLPSKSTDGGLVMFTFVAFKSASAQSFLNDQYPLIKYFKIWSLLAVFTRYRHSFLLSMIITSVVS